MIGLDSELLNVGAPDEAQGAANALARRVATCVAHGGDNRETCVLQAFFEGETLKPTKRDARPLNNTVTTALLEGKVNRPGFTGDPIV